MSRPRARPRFSFESPLAPDAVTERVRRRLARVGADVQGSVHARTINLWVPAAQRHFWSPHLDLQLTEQPGKGTRLDGLFAPHPQIWTAFVAVQAIFALLSIAAAVFLYSQVSLRGAYLREAAGALVAMLVGGGLSYGAAYVGQGFGSEQMYELRAFVDAALRDDG